MKSLRSKPPVQESPTLRHSFFEGCHHENMKGAYEVLSIDGKIMRIRWENGEESDTEVELQDRILSRFEREARAVKAHPGAAKKDGQAYLGPDFRGLVPADFILDAAKTTWRSRTGGLGSPVAQELNTGEFCFGFWVPFGKPVIHWADVDETTGSGAQLPVGFFCRLDEARVYYGLFVERWSEADGKGHWQRALEWLAAPEQDEWICSLAAESGLRLFDPRGTPPSSGFLEASAENWAWVEDDRSTALPSLRTFLANLTLHPSAVLECTAVMEKDHAVRRAAKLGSDIAQLFVRLMPLYRACLRARTESKPSRPARRRPAN